MVDLDQHFSQAKDHDFLLLKKESSSPNSNTTCKQEIICIFGVIADDSPISTPCNLPLSCKGDMEALGLAGTLDTSS